MRRAFVLGVRTGCVIALVLVGGAAGVGWLVDQMDKAEEGLL